MLTVTAINCGFFLGPENFFLADGGAQQLRAPVAAFLIEHPCGKLLFDTGMNPHIRDFVNNSPQAALGFGVELDATQQIASRLETLGVSPGGIDLVALSHLHADHCAGLADIPNATMIIQQDEYDVAFGEDSPMYDRSYFDLGHSLKTVTGLHDVFGDGRVVLVPTPGHSAGHQSLCVRLPDRNVVLAGDCCYTSKILDDEAKLPLALSADPDQHLRSLRMLRHMRDQGDRVICGHDPQEPVLCAQVPTPVESC
jgi:glyoxylase-like metal-dependent hydrolase (beta-lactamase superfamily II)